MRKISALLFGSLVICGAQNVSAQDTKLVQAAKKEGGKVTEIAWTGGKLLDEHYDEFVFISYLADELQPNSTLYFPVVQECEQGVERWIDQAAPGTKEAADHSDTPAPALQPPRHAGRNTTAGGHFNAI